MAITFNIFKRKTDVAKTNQQSNVEMTEHEAREAFCKAMAEAYEEISKESAEKEAKKEAKKQAKKANNERILAEHMARKAAKKGKKVEVVAENATTSFTEIDNEAPAEEAGAEQIDEVETINGNKVTIIDGEKRYTPNFVRKTVTDEGKKVAFSFDKYAKDETDENSVGVSEITSTKEDALKMQNEPETLVSNKDIKDIIVGDATIREYFPNVNRNNVELQNGLILLHVPRENGTSETFRMDIYGDQVFVQVPLDTPLLRYEGQFNDDKTYTCVVVATSSDIGRAALSTPNYFADLNKVDTTALGNAILRENPNEM